MLPTTTTQPSVSIGCEKIVFEKNGRPGGVYANRPLHKVFTNTPSKQEKTPTPSKCHRCRHTRTVSNHSSTWYTISLPVHTLSCSCTPIPRHSVPNTSQVPQWPKPQALGTPRTAWAKLWISLSSDFTSCPDLPFSCAPASRSNISSCFSSALLSAGGRASGGASLPIRSSLWFCESQLLMNSRYKFSRVLVPIFFFLIGK